ncbi:MAG: hypothetical protein QOD06_1870 [Candidatus Binatota bacterium]|nr:hypothetical protein [Candidatus Binatota bacterium]
MNDPFAAVLVLLVAPLWYFAARLGLLSRPKAPTIVAIASAVLLLAAMPRSGLGIPELKRLALLITTAAALLQLCRAVGVPAFGRRELRLALLGLLAVAAIAVHLNFFAFHGRRTYVHLHDVAHYYLGSKYHREVGYDGLYTAMLRAEAELHHDHFRAIEARELETNALVHIRALLIRSEPVKHAFTPERWRSFQADVDYFRQALGPQWGDVLRDNGFNAPPFWALVGGAIANLVPAGNASGILAITLIDGVLEALTFAVIGATFGVEVGLLAIVYFCTIFGTGFGWTGGAYLRYLELAGVLIAAAELHRRRHAAAGALLGLATLLRLFPAVLLAGLALRSARSLLRGEGLPPGHVRLFGAFAAVVVVGVALTATAPAGAAHWREFRDKLRLHVEFPATNRVSLLAALTYPGERLSETPEGHAREVARRNRLHRIQLLVAAPLVLLLLILVARRLDDVGALAAGVPVLFVTLDVTGYYWWLLLLLLIANRDRPAILALLFAVEAGSYSLLLFEDAERLLYAWRSILVGVALLAVYLDPLRQEARRLRVRFRTLPRVTA